MAGLRFNSLAGLIAAGSMLFSATAATAQSAPAPQQVSPWAALTILAGGAPAAALCGAAATTAAAQSAAPGCVLPALDAPAPVAQARAAPTPVPPVAAPGGGLGFSPLLLGLVAIAVAAGAYLLTRNGHGNQQQNSPV